MGSFRKRGILGEGYNDSNWSRKDIYRGRIRVNWGIEIWQMLESEREREGEREREIARERVAAGVGNKI